MVSSEVKWGELAVAFLPKAFLFGLHPFYKCGRGDGPVEFVGVLGEEADDGVWCEAILGTESRVGEQREEAVGIELKFRAKELAQSIEGAMFVNSDADRVLVACV